MRRGGASPPRRALLTSRHHQPNRHRSFFRPPWRCLLVRLTVPDVVDACTLYLVHGYTLLRCKMSKVAHTSAGDIFAKSITCIEQESRRLLAEALLRLP